MISIKSKLSTFPSSLCDWQASQDGHWGWFVCTRHEEHDSVLEEIQAEVKLEIMNSSIASVSRMEIDNWLRTFFADFHWKMHARLRKTELREKGLSLFFGVIFESEIHFVQFGRLFCAVTKGKKLIQHGRAWKNHRAQSLAEMNLFGLSEGDIKVKLQRLLIEDNEKMLVIPSQIVNRIVEQGVEVNSLVPVVEAFSSQDNAQWLILENQPRLRGNKKRKLSRVQISSFFLLLLTFLAILYMAFGNRACDVFLRKARVKADSAKISTSLKVDPDILKYWESVVNAPLRSIELTNGWTTDLEYPVTAAPAFDQNNIYIASGNRLTAFGKRNRNMVWDRAFPSKIESLHQTKYGLMLNLADHQIVGLSNEGKVAWADTLKSDILPNTPVTSIELTNREDPRIDGSVTVIPMEKGLSALDSQRGTLLSEITFTNQLQSISEYDRYDSCFYAVVENAVVCVIVKVVNR